MTTHAMIDLETLDVLPTAVVLTIGGVKFDPNAIKETTQHFYYRFNVDEQLNKGRTTSKSTLDWWATQEQSVVDEALGDHDRTIDRVIVVQVLVASSICSLQCPTTRKVRIHCLAAHEGA